MQFYFLYRKDGSLQKVNFRTAVNIQYFERRIFPDKEGIEFVFLLAQDFNSS